MGGRAYGTLAESTARGSSRVLAAVFAELAHKFQPLVDALNEVSETSYTHSDRDVLRLYEVWLKTGSRAATPCSSAWGSIRRPPAARPSHTERNAAALAPAGALGGIYDVRIAHDVYDFLVTDRARLPAAARAGGHDEELLVAAVGRRQRDGAVLVPGSGAAAAPGAGRSARRGCTRATSRTA